MINGFEDITAKLSETEKNLIPEIARVLAKKIGPDMAVTSKKIQEGYAKRGIKLTGPRIRKMLNYIRMNCMIDGLVASSKGYYVSHDPETIRAYAKSLEQREAAIRAVRKRQEQFLIKLLNHEKENQ